MEYRAGLMFQIKWTIMFSEGLSFWIYNVIYFDMISLCIVQFIDHEHTTTRP